MSIIAVDKNHLDIKAVNWLALHREYLQEGEMECIVALLRQIGAQTVVEIGCRDGRTACVLLQNVRSLQRYIGIDVAEDYQPTLAHQRNEMVSNPGHLASHDPRFDLIIRKNGSFDITPKELKEYAHAQIDAVFIDGDHSEKAVLHDSLLAHDAMHPGGMIIWHDFFNGAVEVERVLNRLSSENRWTIFSIKNTWLAYSRRNSRRGNPEPPKDE
jgi:predicted O-methyltransferase YrrM